MNVEKLIVWAHIFVFFNFSDGWIFNSMFQSGAQSIWSHQSSLAPAVNLQQERCSSPIPLFPINHGMQAAPYFISLSRSHILFTVLPNTSEKFGSLTTAIINSGHPLPTSLVARNRSPLSSSSSTQFKRTWSDVCSSTQKTTTEDSVYAPSHRGIQRTLHVH